ncbi:amidase domain-containing protein [Virgibacillus sp. 179-BFC.A HS]|uniref:Amidase domain-containing protein n=1 Tax=Tigheibacillus jepli TaxID=3035914 RepID=A0ABU5CJ22_9BACI|nr:amidase domain-containing protein [Virgibacillus sp. 179-BFC.A HS]MDY0406338.1 amidase domain-containing protein [Virgibacillus sp. 179-BFC.A HS]
MTDFHTYWNDFFQNDSDEQLWWNRKVKLCQKREVEMVHIKGSGHVFQNLRTETGTYNRYLLHLSILMKQGSHFYMEEQVMPFVRYQKDGKEIHQLLDEPAGDQSAPPLELLEEEQVGPQRFVYDRMAAVQYAETWWNSYNPAYRQFDVDCTNFVSQCLHAGGAPMWGAPNRNKGWWYQNNNWSYSWAVANSLRWYLSGSKQGLKGLEVQSPQELVPGDVICYDFEGDGRYNHNTIVVAKDAYGMPLVNAHTNNSRHRYWSYEDSAAWTPEINYKFFRIGET